MIDRKRSLIFVVIFLILFLFTPVKLDRVSDICQMSEPMYCPHRISESVLLLGLPQFEFDIFSGLYTLFNLIASYMISGFVGKRLK